MGEDLDLSQVETILEGLGAEPFDVMEALQDIQQHYRYLPEAAMCRVSEALNVPVIEVFRLANFYKAFSLKPRGRHLLTVCKGTACHVQGSQTLFDEVLGQLEVEPGGTTHDKAFTVEAVHCVGACALAPVVIIDGKYYDHMTPGKLRKLIRGIRANDEKEDGEADAQNHRS
jgi:NADH:ubiquinone oxidoreductase subunit E